MNKLSRVILAVLCLTTAALLITKGSPVAAVLPIVGAVFLVIY